MTDPYTEATRHERRGLPTFAKVILVAGGLLAATLVTIAVVGVIYARKAADDWIDRFETAFEDMELDGTTAEAVANMAETVLGDELQIAEGDFGASALTLRGEANGADFDIDLSGLDEWVSDMETLIEQGIEDGVRIEGETDESGGWITVRRTNGRGILELRGDESGGILRVYGPRTETRIGLGGDADGIPGWVPVHPDARIHKHLFSGDSRKGSFGGVALSAEADARHVFDWYTDNLPRAGLGVSRSRMNWDARRKRGKIHARSDGLARNREMFVLIWENEEGESAIVLMHKVER